MSSFPHLFSPIKIGPVTLRNRIVSTAHQTLYADNMLPSEREAYYYAEKAKGGVGLMVTGATSVHPTSTGGFMNNGIAYDKKAVSGYQRIADMVHQHDGVILVQLFHCGIHTDSTMVFDDWRPVWGPSAVPCVMHRDTPKVMDRDDIEEVLDGFVESAVNVQEAGIDGVEVHAAHSYLLHQFLSPVYNKRTDEYGGSLENRLHLLMEVIEGIREACGKDFVLGVKISGDEFLPEGLTLTDMQEVARRLEATRQVDYLAISAGTYNSSALITGNMHVPPGHNVPLAAGIKKAVKDMPIVAIGRISDPVQAEKILADGHADLVGMTRATIADPELPNKAQAGRLDEIRNCVACNQFCRRIFNQRPLTCIQNPAAGREKELGMDTYDAAPHHKKVVVIGGGPAGMEAARVAATRGHEIILLEKEDELGGRVNIAARGPGRQEFGGIARNLINQITCLSNVKIITGLEATSEGVLGMNPDVVIVATGSVPLQTGFSGLRPYLNEIPGIEQGNVFTYIQVMMGEAEVGDRVLVIDESCHQEGMTTIELLADQGRQVEVVTRFPFVGMDGANGHEQQMWYVRVLSKGVSIQPFSVVEHFDGSTVTIANVFSKQQSFVQDIDGLVLSMGNRSEDNLYHELKGKVREIYRVGDCVAPRRVAQAVYEGHLIGRQI